MPAVPLESAAIFDDGDGLRGLVYDGKIVPGVLMLSGGHDDGVHLIVPGVIEVLCSLDQVLRWARVLVNAAGLRELVQPASRTAGELHQPSF